MHFVRTMCGMLLVSVLVAVPAHAQSTTTGISRQFNPAISVNALLLGRVADTSTEPTYNGVRVQEAEAQFTSVVDPFWQAVLIFAVHPAHDHEADSHGGYNGDLEVAYMDGTAIPGGFALRLGKDYLPFGKHVPLHTHQFPFVDAPVAVQAFLGEHGLTEVGVRLAHDLPLPWYSDLEGYAVDGKAVIFAGGSRDAVFGARWINLLDLSSEATLELSGSWLHGPLASDYLLLPAADPLDPLHGALDIFGADATFKWISASRTRGPALYLTGEVIIPRPDHGAGDPCGWYAVAQYRLADNWWLGVGGGAMKRDLPDGVYEDELFAWEEVAEYKANLNWVPSEFSAVRLEGAYFNDLADQADDWLVSLQLNFTIGSHPAHLY